MKTRFLTLLAISLTLVLALTVPAMASEVVPESENLEQQAVPALALDHVAEDAAVHADVPVEAQIVQNDTDVSLGQGPNWLQADSSLVPELQNSCLPPSPPPPSCDCSFCCECNKCWKNGQLVRMPCEF